ncbi:MAG: nucleotide exchange factor GrpE [Actinomycetota bacterium]
MTEHDRRKVKVTDGGPARPGSDKSAAGSAGEPTEPAEKGKEAEELREHLQRLQAEFENYRKRVLKEQTRAVEMAAEPLIQQLLEVVDDFDLALMSGQKQPDYESFLHGVELVYAKLLESLKSAGVERIEAEGAPFDPEVHEALMSSGEGEGDLYVDDVLRQGYKMKGRVIRPAGVRVGRRSPERS